jgi:hypothetical protein
VGSGTGKNSHCSDAMQAEATAVLKAPAFVEQIGISRIELETGATNLKAALTLTVFD